MGTEDQDREEFLNTRVTYGLILRTNLESLQEFKEFLADQEDSKVVYQTTSAGKLRIVEEEENR